MRKATSGAGRAFHPTERDPDWYDYQSRDTTLRPGAARYECGTLNTAGCYGMLAAIELLLEVGIERVGRRVTARGYRLLTPPDGDAASGIVAFQKDGVDSVEAVERLAAPRIAAAPRSGWIRTSPHFYLSEEEAERLLAALPR